MKRDPRALQAALADLERQQLKRFRSTVESFAEGTDSRVLTVAVQSGGSVPLRRRLVDFSSNDYLALRRHPGVAAAMSASAERCGAGSGASHLVTGHGVEHARLEEELAEFTGRERALLFSTGYMANLAVVSSLAGRGEVVVLDRLSHASLIDAGLLSGARFKRYAHGDASAAGRALAQSASSAAVLATDGVFSMDGDIAPLESLAQASREHRAWLVVDDAHGLGVIGSGGRGSLELLGLGCDEVPLLMGTLGKAFGSFGAFLAGPGELIELLMQKSRPYIYTTALPQPVAAASRAGLRIAQQESWRRERAMAMTHRFRSAALQMDVPLADSVTPIQPVVLGSADAVLRAQQELANAGFWVVAIRPPTVPRGSARLRVTLSAGHTESQVDSLVEALARICRGSRAEAPARARAGAGGESAAAGEIGIARETVAVGEIGMARETDTE